MRQHVTAVRDVANQLSNVGETVKSGYIIAVLMNSLPESYLPMVTMLEGHKEEELTVNYVAAKLEDEYERRQEAGIDRHDSNKALQASYKVGGKNDSNKRQRAAGGKSVSKKKHDRLLFLRRVRSF